MRSMTRSRVPRHQSPPAATPRRCAPTCQRSRLSASSSRMRPTLARMRALSMRTGCEVAIARLAHQLQCLFDQLTHSGQLPRSAYVSADWRNVHLPIRASQRAGGGQRFRDLDSASSRRAKSRRRRPALLRDDAEYVRQTPSIMRSTASLESSIPVPFPGPLACETLRRLVSTRGSWQSANAIRSGRLAYRWYSATLASA